MNVIMNVITSARRKKKLILHKFLRSHVFGALNYSQNKNLIKMHININIFCSSGIFAWEIDKS